MRSPIAARARWQSHIVVQCPERIAADEEGLEHGLNKLALHPLKVRARPASAQGTSTRALRGPSVRLGSALSPPQARGCSRARALVTRACSTQAPWLQSRPLAQLEWSPCLQRPARTLPLPSC